MEPFTTVVMASSADRSGGDVAIPIAVGETSVSGNGVPGTGTQWYPSFDGSIVGAIVNSETAAMLECMFHKTTDPNYNKLHTTHLQTDPLRTQIYNPCNYPIKKGDAISARGLNGGAVLDCLALYITKSGGPAISAIPPSQLPPGTMLVRATGTVTAVADSLAEGTIAFDEWIPERDVVYSIIAMGAGGAAAGGTAGPNDGVFTRLKFLEGPYATLRPGVPCADASTGLEYMMFYGDFGEFKGQTPPNFEHLELAAGAESVGFTFLIYPKSKSK